MPQTVCLCSCIHIVLRIPIPIISMLKVSPVNSSFYSINHDATPGTLEMEMMNKKEKKIKIRTQNISLNRNKNETHSNIKYRLPNDKTNNLFIRPARTTCSFPVNIQTYTIHTPKGKRKKNNETEYSVLWCCCTVQIKPNERRGEKKTSNACYDLWLDLSSDSIRVVFMV